jgi:DNA-binding NarL/FixJ family response regulator
MKKPIHLAIVDDHVILREGLISLLSEYDEINIVFEANNGMELLDNLKKSKPDIVLLDISMPIMNGKEALEKMQIKYPEIKVVIFTQYFEDDYILEFIKAGANAFLPKNCNIDKLLDALNYVYEHGYYFDNRISAIMASLLKKSTSLDSLKLKIDLTKQEIKVIKLVCMKKTNAEIAEELFLSVRTIESHRYNISKKTNTHSAIELLQFAERNGILTI